MVPFSSLPTLYLDAGRYLRLAPFKNIVLVVVVEVIVIVVGIDEIINH